MTAGPAEAVDGRPVFRPTDGWLAGIVLALLTFWLFANTFINVRPMVADGLGLDASAANLAVSITALFTGSFIVVAGRVADRVGRARILRLGLLASIIGSLLVAIVPPKLGALTLVLLLLGRIIQGFSAAAIMPAGLALIKTYYDGAERQRAVSFYSMGTFGGSGLTAFVGGAIAATFLGWRGIFVLSILAAAIALVLLRRTPETRVAASEADERGFDWTGLATFLIAIFAINIYISQGPKLGFLSGTGLGLLGLFAVALAAFLLIELRRRGPFLDLSLFAIPRFTGAVVANFLVNCSIGTLFIALNYSQLAAGWSALQASLMTIGFLIAILVCIRVGEKLLQRLGTRRPMLWGIGILILGNVLVGLTVLPLGAWATMATIGLTLFGVGLGFFATPATDASITSVPSAQVGAASGLFKMASSLGSATGLAVAGTVLTAVSAMDGATFARWGVFAGVPEASSLRAAAMLAIVVLMALLAIALVVVAVLIPRPAAQAGDGALPADDADASSR